MNYVAKRKGISRSLKLYQAEQQVPDLLVIRKDIEDGKPETLNLLRTSQEILSAIKSFRNQNHYQFTLERASCDEFFLELTADVRNYLQQRRSSNDDLLNLNDLGNNTHLEGRRQRVQGKSILHKLRNVKGNVEYTNETMLVIGATIMEGLRRFILSNPNTRNLSSSCGIGANKLLAKLAVSAHKPSGVTILPDYGLPRFCRQIKIQSIPKLQGQMGQMVLKRAQRYFNKEYITMKDLHNLRKEQLFRCLQCGPVFAGQIFQIVHGICSEPVIAKDRTQTVSDSRKINTEIKSRVFVKDSPAVNEIITDAANSLCKKLILDNHWNNRVPSTISVKIQFKKDIPCIGFIIEDFNFREPRTIISNIERKLTEKVAQVNGNPFLTRFELKVAF